MYYKNVFVFFVAFSLFIGFTWAKKTKKPKPPRIEESFQPDVVAYSSFGFTDVGTHDRFVPSSPDYANFLKNPNEVTTTELYRPAFPSALDSTGFGSNYANIFYDGTQEPEENIDQNSGMLHYPQSSVNLFSDISSVITEDQNKNKRNEDFHTPNTEEIKYPVYGTKLNHKPRNRQRPKPFNNTEYNVYSSSDINPSDNNFFSFSDVSSIYKSIPTFNETNLSYSSGISSQAHVTIDSPKYKQNINPYEPLNFTRVVDFTNTNQFEATGVDIDSPSVSKPLDTGFTIYKNQNEDSFANSLNHNSHKIKFHNFIHNNDDEQTTKPNTYNDNDYSQGFSLNLIKNYTTGNKLKSENKKKQKKPWSAANITNYNKNWKDSLLKGYQYSTNNSHMTFKYNMDNYKKGVESDDEVKAASSNSIDFKHYQLPEPDFAKFSIKREPDFSKIKPVIEEEEEEYPIYQSFKEKIKHNEHNDHFQDFLSMPLTTTTSYWGNSFKTPEYFSVNNPQMNYQFTDDIDENLATMPRAPPKSIYNKLPDSKLIDWTYGYYKPQKPSKPSKELFVRFKSEEDLLGLRNHDTSHPSYLPTFHPNLDHGISDDHSSYKKLVDKWKESYLKAKYKDSALRDYENYASETKAVHVPMPRPYPVSQS